MLVLVLVGAMVNKPKPPELTTFQSGETIVREGNLLNLPDARVESKPVRVSLDLAMLEFDLLPSEQEGEIQIEASYDKANFDLTTNIEEKNDYIDYKISFKNKRSMFGIIWGAKNDNRNLDNELKVFLPKHLLYLLDMKMEFGEFNVDLSGLAVQSLDVDMSKGEFDLEMKKDNLVPMENMEVRTGMGEFRLEGLNHMGFRKGTVTGSMGEMSLASMGPFREDMDLVVNMSMGEARLEIPDNVEVDSNIGVFLGGMRGARALDPSVQEPKTLNLKGGIRLGEMNVVRRNYTPKPKRILRTLLENQDVDAVINQAREFHQEKPEYFEISRVSINSMGYDLMHKNRMEDALKLFNLNIEFYPECANCYDSLGEAYLKTGDRESALAQFERSLELEPDNEDLRETVERLKRGEEP